MICIHTPFGSPLLAALIAMASPRLVQGSVLFDRCVNVVPAPSFWYGEATTHESSFQAFDEAQSVPFDGTLHVQALHRWDDIEHLVPIELDAAVLDSHMVFFNKAASGWVHVVAEVEFDAPIVGVIADAVLFGDAQSIFAPAPTHRQPAERPNIWSLEEGRVMDRVTLLSPTRLRLDFRNSLQIDPLRVITLRRGSAFADPHPPFDHARHLFLPASTRPGAEPEDASTAMIRPGELVVVPPTERSLAITWHVSGDANTNATVVMKYRRHESEAWSQPTPMHRTGARLDGMHAGQSHANDSFTGSILDLAPETDYTCRLEIQDPDGIAGSVLREVSVRTLSEPSVRGVDSLLPAGR